MDTTELKSDADLREWSERITRNVTKHSDGCYERINPENFCFGLMEPYELAKAYLAEHVTARIKLRNDNGPTEQLSDPQEFVLLDGLYYRAAWIKSGQGLRREQLEVER